MFVKSAVSLVKKKLGYIYPVMCSCIGIIRIHLEILGQVKIGFFSYPDGILGGIQDFQAKSGESLKIGVVGQSEIRSVK